MSKHTLFVCQSCHRSSAEQRSTTLTPRIKDYPGAKAMIYHTQQNHSSENRSHLRLPSAIDRIVEAVEE